MESVKPRLLLAALTRSRSGALASDVVKFSKELEAWIDQGKDPAERALRFEALMMAYDKFGPAGIEGALTDCAQVIYDYLRPVEEAPPAPPETGTSQESKKDGERAQEATEASKAADLTAVRPRRGRQKRSGRAG